MTIGSTVTFNASLGQHVTTLQSCYWMVGTAHPYFSMCNKWEQREDSIHQHTFPLLAFALLSFTQDLQMKRSYLVCHSLGRQ